MQLLLNYLISGTESAFFSTLGSLVGCILGNIGYALGRSNPFLMSVCALKRRIPINRKTAITNKIVIAIYMIVPLNNDRPYWDVSNRSTLLSQEAFLK